MNVEYLQTNIDSLIDYMRVNGYGVNSLKHCRTVTNYVINLDPAMAWTSYDEVREWVKSKAKKIKSCRQSGMHGQRRLLTSAALER